VRPSKGHAWHCSGWLAAVSKQGYHRRLWCAPRRRRQAGAQEPGPSESPAPAADVPVQPARQLGASAAGAGAWLGPGSRCRCGSHPLFCFCLNAALSGPLKKSSSSAGSTLAALAAAAAPPPSSPSCLAAAAAAALPLGGLAAFLDTPAPGFFAAACCRRAACSLRCALASALSLCAACSSSDQSMPRLLQSSSILRKRQAHAGAVSAAPTRPAIPGTAGPRSGSEARLPSATGSERMRAVRAWGCRSQQPRRHPLCDERVVPLLAPPHAHLLVQDGLHLRQQRRRRAGPL
jgi:hypothetical protein